MTQDFAKKKHKPPQEPPPAAPRLILFLSGMVTGAFMTFLAGLWYISEPSGTSTSQAGRPTAKPDKTVTKQSTDEMKWDFYEIFPRTEVPVVEEYDTTGTRVRADQYAWILQVGSFRDPKDADELRASLLLEGLDVTTTSVTMDDTEWHRVVVGPFESELERNRAQDRLARAEIKAIPMRIPR